MSSMTETGSVAAGQQCAQIQTFAVHSHAVKSGRSAYLAFKNCKGWRGDRQVLLSPLWKQTFIRCQRLDLCAHSAEALRGWRPQMRRILVCLPSTRYEAQP